tara:strand:+ start:6164 stop:6682 length:519 start_codon:yes stop_codon:yes gene_type:complete
MKEPDREFVFQLTDWQNRLFGYLVTLLGNTHDARDVLQETNLVLWQKIEEYDSDTNFGAWSKKCAYFQALAFLRDRKRDRHIFDDDLLTRFAEEEPEHSDEEERDLALRDCLSQLPDQQREIISERYRRNTPVRQVAKIFGKKENAMKVSLMRIRQSLFRCIESKLEASASS